MWRGRDVALKLTLDGFRDYVKNLKFDSWRPSGLTIHNTAEPNRERWRAYPGEQWLRNLKSYYSGLGWSAGPHWFCDGDDIWIMTDLNVRGTHSPGFNGTRLGCEMVADFSKEDDDSGIGLRVKQQAAETFAIVCARMGWEPNGEIIKMHKEDPQTDHDCPGKDFEKPEFLKMVQGYMGGSGDHDPNWGTVAAPPAPAPAPAPAAPPANGPVLPQALIDKVVAVARASTISRHQWKDKRGLAPIGYIIGMAVTYALVLRKLKAGDPGVAIMAMAATGKPGDALSWYAPQFAELHMDNSRPGVDALRHTFDLLLGLGMRESSGNCFEGLDVQAGFKSADETEAGLFQQSRNSFSASPELPKLMAAYEAHPTWGFLRFFREGVPGGPSQDHGTGPGKDFQRLCKISPAFAVEAAAILIRLDGGERGHFGPLRRHDAEVRPETDAMFLAVQKAVDEVSAGGDIQPPGPSPAAPSAPAPAPAGGNPLGGKRLRYRINGLAGYKGKEGEITEGGFGEKPAPLGDSLKYGNFLDQRVAADGKTPVRVCDPYLKATGTANKYKEGVPDPDGPGFVKNLTMQRDEAIANGEKYIELDNPDDEHFTVADVVRGIELFAEKGIGVVAKNPGLLEARAQVIYVKHPNIFGVIIENGAGDVAQMVGLRQAAGKPELPLWFVAFDDKEGGHEWAKAQAAAARGHANVFVTYDPSGQEYADAVDVVA